ARLPRRSLSTRDAARAVGAAPPARTAWRGSRSSRAPTSSGAARRAGARAAPPSPRARPADPPRTCSSRRRARRRPRPTGRPSRPAPRAARRGRSAEPTSPRTARRTPPRAQAGAARHADAARAPGAESRAAEDRERRRDRVEGEERLERIEVDFASGQRAQLGGERQADALRSVVERLDPEAVARQDEPTLPTIPDRDSEHAPQPLGKSVAQLLVEVHEHLRVALRAEPMARALQLGAQLPVVVELAVLDDVHGAVLVRERLVAGLEVDDREPPRRQPDRAVKD